MTLSRRLSCVLCLLLISTQNSFADHYLGGELTWKCYEGSNPAFQGRYVFTLKLYRDCRGADINSVPQTINFSGGASFILSYISRTDITPSCAGVGIPSCRGPSSAPKGAVHELIFSNAANPVQLPSIAPPAWGWTFYTNTYCCRPINQNLSPSSTQLTVRAKMYPYKPGNRTISLPAHPCYDGSPRFLARPASVICSDYKFVYNHLAGDKELDSLWYAWDYPIGTYSGPGLAFNSGYSYNAPFPDQTENPANGPVVLEGSTGQMTIEAYNPLPGNYISCIKVEAWKNCQLKAEVFRDLAVVYATNCAANNPPTTSIDLNAYPNVKQRGDNYYTSVYPGDTVRFRILATETDLNNGVQLQTISMKVVNDELGDPYPSTMGCLSGKQPCATLTRIGTGDFEDEILQIEGEFLWVPGCSHLATERGCRGLSNSYPLVFRVQDNACPANGIGVLTVIVEVLRDEPHTPPLQCVSLEENKQVTVSWEQPPIDSGLSYAYYLVYADSGNGNYGVVDTVYDYNQLSTVISPNMIPNGITAPNGYYVVAVTNSRAGCPFFSEPSDTLYPMQVSLTQPTGGRSDTLQLDWNSLHSNQPTDYDIWVEVPKGSGNWKHFDQTADTSLNSFLSACSDTAVFQIRVTDLTSGCTSSSSISNDGRFTDTVNRDVLVIDSVTVSQASGLTNISWAASGAPDVTAYILLFNDHGLGWIVIDTIPMGTLMPYVWANSQAQSRSEGFRVISLDSCGNQSDDRAVVEHRSIHLREYLNKCEGYLRLSWSSYKGFKGGVGQYRLYYTETDINGITGVQTLAFTGGVKDTIRRLNHLNPGSEYCFVVRAYDTTGAISSSSNEVCVNASVTVRSKELYLTQVTYNSGKNALVLGAILDGAADAQLFAVERALDRYGPWKQVTAIAKPPTAPYRITFTDFGANPAHAYYYRITATDSCGLRDTVSNIGRNIVVYPRPNENLTNTLRWTPYQSWDGEVGGYDIYRSVDDGNSYTKVGSAQGYDTTFTDNISAFAHERVPFCYHVVATEVNNPNNYIDDSGKPYSSVSNTACIQQRVKLFMPNAFRPNSAIIDNQTFGPSVRFEDVSRYRLLVLNRWGTVVFETTDPTRRWDGTHQGKPMPPGVYVYKVQYATVGDVQEEEMGSFSLLR